MRHVSHFLAATAFTALASLAANAQSFTTQIALPSSIVEGIAANPGSNLIYVVSPSGYPDVDDSVAVIDGKTDTIIKYIPVPVGAYYPAVDPIKNKIYVAGCNNFIELSPCFVTVIDGRTNTVVTTIPISTVKNGFLAGIADDAFDSVLYVTDNKSGTVAVINTGTDKLVKTIDLGGETPFGVAINPFISNIYVTLGSGKMDILTVHSDKIVTVSTGANTSVENVAVDPRTNRVYVVNSQFGPSTVSVLYGNGEFITQVPAGQGAYGIDVDPYTNLIFVAAVNDENTTVIDGKTETVTSSVEGTSPFFVSVNPRTQKVYTAGSGLVSVSPE